MILALLFFISLFTQAGTEFHQLPHISYFRNPYYYSEGFRLGFVLDFHRSGFPFWIWSYEGELMTGFGSDKMMVVDQYCMADEMAWISEIKDEQKKQTAMQAAKTQCYVFDNPWNFSTLNAGLYETYLGFQNLQFTPVLIYYVSPIFSFSRAITNTSNFVEGIYSINPSLDIPKSYKVPSYDLPIAGTFNKDRGFKEGRIVTASLDHYVRKSFEVTLQEGPYGNNFRRMSVSDQEMFDFIVKAMLTGKMVRVEYVKITDIENEILRIGKSYDTPYRVVSLEVEGNNALAVPPFLRK